MPIASPETYAEMISRAKKSHFAYPAFNVSSLEMLNAVLTGFAEADSDGIIAISTNAARFVSGGRVQDMVIGAVTFAEFAHRVADRYPVNIALHTDHCPLDSLPQFVEPLLDLTEQRRRGGLGPLFQSHMWDGSAIDLASNLDVAARLLERCRGLDVVLELEVGVVGGEREGLAADHPDRLYTTPEDMLTVVDTLGHGERGRFLLAATFGNVHGVYKPGNVRLEPKILLAGQRAVGKAVGVEYPLDLVFHGGSGSSLDEIRETLDYGVVKMNISTDAEYAYTRAIADHVLRNYDGVMKVDGGVGDKKSYDPRVVLRSAQQSLTARVVEACSDLRSAGTSLH